MYTKENFKNDVDSTFNNPELNTNGVVSSSTFEKIKTVIKKSVDIENDSANSSNGTTLTIKKHGSNEINNKLFEPAKIVNGVVDLDFNTDYMPWMYILNRNNIDLSKAATYPNFFSRLLTNGKIMKYDLVIPENYIGKDSLGKSPAENSINVGSGWSSSVARLPFANSSVALIDQFRSTIPASESVGILKIGFNLDKSAGLTFDETETIASGYKLVIDYVNYANFMKINN